ncbi:MAG: glycosyltransferase, partial [Burkholderiales bacterium]|nr:glycosyltransferase [Burkholderiales bacterium]
MRLLTFSTLFPSSVRPNHGIFVETRLRELLKSGQVDVRVVAPVPWFPSTHARFGEYATAARTPRREVRNGIDVLHPRYVLLPKVGMTLSPLGLALGAYPALRTLQHEGFDFDVIDAHYYYPDGVAAALLARRLGKPFTITARGTDLNLIPAYAAPRRMMQWAASRADASIGVCSALVDVLRGWKVEESRLKVMRNGVDLERFRPLPPERARAELQLDGDPVLLSVG